jgi:hypothetical protein
MKTKVWSLSLALFFGFIPQAFSISLPVVIDSSLSPKEKQKLVEVLNEAAEKLPPKFIDGLPKDLKVKVLKITNHTSIPDDICASKITEKAEEKEEEKEGKKKEAFVYGVYTQRTNTLALNAAVMAELLRGRLDSKKIGCQHFSLYDQSVSTIIHELTHAYDYNNGVISNSMEYIRRAGFKKGLLKVKSKNIEAMRSADPYELVSVTESFAVNMEYFAMDPQFMCRKPSLFDYYKKHFGFDPYPERDCTPNNLVMMSTIQGYIPVALESKRVYRIDYLLASAGKGIQSGFGHSMFRIVMCAPERLDLISGKIIPATPFGKKCLEDKLFHTVVSYRANVEDATLNYLKGLTGGYPSMLFILNFGDVLDEYNRDELRDVIAYPLSLSSKEKEEFITRVIEEHWNYRGAYKFINNNCAVESYDLLKGAIERESLNDKKSVTPNGVLEDLDRLEFTSTTHQEKEVYKAKTDQLLLAYRDAFGGKISGSEKAQKDAVMKFMEKSNAKSRMKTFSQFQSKGSLGLSLNEEVVLLKERLVTASSFSVMEQQILRTLALKFRKTAADKFMNTTDENAKKVIAETGAAFVQPFKSLSSKGYGIPLADEVVSKEILDQKVVKAGEAMKKADNFLKELMPVEYAALEEIAENIKVYNAYSLSVRKDFRSKLDKYILEVLKNMTLDDNSRSLLLSAAEGNKDSLKQVRNYLGSDLVTEKDILDTKLRKIIAELL